MNPERFFILALAFMLLFCKGNSQTVDFSDAAIFLPEKKDKSLLKAAQVLQEEIHKRSHLLLPVINNLSAENRKVITIGIEGRMDYLPQNSKSAMRKLPETGKEGFKIIYNGNKSIIVAGHEEAGAFYGAGWLLRKMEISDHLILVPTGINISSIPAYSLYRSFGAQLTVEKHHAAGGNCC